VAVRLDTLLNGIRDVSEGCSALTYLIVFPFSFTAVNAADSDIIVESSDLTLFRLHRKNLQAYAGAFPLPPAAESTTTNENSSVAKIRLPEPVGVLEILFEYLYPKVRQPHPDLDDLDFKEFMSISDAVGKYQVFAAKHLCLIRLRYVCRQTHSPLLWS